MRKVWNGTTWVASNIYWGITRPVAWPYNYIVGKAVNIVEGTGSGLVRGAKKELEPMVKPDGPLISQLNESVKQALLRQPPQELLQLKDLIKKALEHTEDLTPDDVRSMDAHLKLLFREESKLLKLLAPDLTPQELELFQKVARLFKETAENPLLDSEGSLLDLEEPVLERFKQNLANASKQDLQNFDTVFNTILDSNHGALIQAMSFLQHALSVFQHALLADEQGILSQAVEVLKSKATDEKNGLVRKVIDQLTQLLDKENGPLDLLTQRLTVGDKSIIAQAVDLLKGKLLEKDGVVEEIDKRFNNETDGIIMKAMAIAKKNIDETLQNGLALLQAELTSETGLMTTLKQQITTNEDSVLKQAIALLNESLYHSENGIVSKLRQELTSEDKGVLAEALKLFGKALNDEKEGILVQSMALLKQKLNDENGLVDEAMRLLEFKLNGKEGVVEKLQHRLLNEHDGALVKVLHLLQAKLNDEKTGIIAQAAVLLEKRLLDEHGMIDTLEKKLTEEETGTIAKAVESMKRALEKKDGPLDLLDQSIQKSLSDALELMKHKCLDEKDGLLAQTLELASKKLNAENGLLDTLTKRLNDPKDGIIAKAIEALNNKLLEENGPFDLLQKKLLDEKDGLLTKAIDLLNLKLQQTGGPLDTLQKKLMDKDGILDQALNMLEDRLTNAEKGILVQAKQYLSGALNDEKQGILVQAMDLLKRKFQEKGGPIDLLNVALTDKETGIFSRAAGILQEKLMEEGGLVDQLDERLTSQAHPLLANSYRKLNELRKAIIDQNKIRIQKSSKELQQLLEQLTARTALVFNKKPLANEDQFLLNQLKTRLPDFYGNTPPDQGDMLVAVEAARAAVNRYYGSYEGIAARTATILQETLSDAIEPILSRVENIPKKMVNNLLGVPDDAPAEVNGGTASQFLNAGGSVLKQMLEKGVQAVSKQGLSSFGSLLTLGIKEILKKMGNAPEFDRPKFLLNSILDNLNSAQENRNWSNLYQSLVKASEALKPVKIYVNGFRIPDMGPKVKSVSQFLEKGGSILNRMLEKGDLALSEQSLSSFENSLVSGIEQALNKMDDTPEFLEPKTILNGIKASLDAIKAEGNWSNLSQRLVAASQALNSVEIYINDFDIPNMDIDLMNAEEIYSDNMNALQGDMDSAPAKIENETWKKMAEDEKNILVDNLTKFLTIKHIYEDVCGLKNDDELFYVRLLKKAKKAGAQSDAELKKLFFEELEKSKVNFVIRLYARIQYFFYDSIVKGYIKKASNIYFEEIFNYINQDKKLHALRNQVTTNFTRYLTILGGAYDNVAESRNTTGTLNEMLQKELEKKESNLGFDTKELYLEFTQIVLRKTLGSGILGWIARKFISNPEEIVRSLINKSLGSMYDVRGYTDALNSVIREQLEEIWHLLQTEHAHQQNDPAEGASELPDVKNELSDVKKNELDALVKNLFEILAKSKCQKKSELRDLIKGKLLSAKVNQAIDDLFIEEIISKVTDLLAISVQSLVQKNQLHKLTYKFASLVNRTFEVADKEEAGKEIKLQQTPEEELRRMRKEEREIARLSGQILRFAVNTAVKETFDPAGKKQQKEANRFISDLHKLSTQLFTTTGQDLTALKEMDFSSVEGKSKIKKIIAETLAYESKCYGWSIQAKSSKVNTDNKEEIDERYLGIADRSQPFVQAIKQLKQHSRTLENLQTVVPHLKEMITIASAIPLPLFRPGGPTNEDLVFCENQLTLLDTHLVELKKMQNHAALAEQIVAQTRIFATILIDVKKAMKTNSFCAAQAQPGCLLEQIVNEKKESLGRIAANNASFKNILTMIKQEVGNAFDETYRPQLLMKLKNIEEATLSQQIDTAQQEFIAICRQAMTQANTSIEAHGGNYHQAYLSMVNAINQTHLLEPDQDETARRGIRDTIDLAQRHLQTLATWEEQHIRLIPYINFSPIDMKEWKDWASGLVCSRVRERLEGFMGFLKREETYRYGLLNHLFLLPYVQAAKKLY